jgi:hypothetical protein
MEVYRQGDVVIRKLAELAETYTDDVQEHQSDPCARRGKRPRTPIDRRGMAVRWRNACRDYLCTFGT